MIIIKIFNSHQCSKARGDNKKPFKKIDAVYLLKNSFYKLYLFLWKIDEIFHKKKEIVDIFPFQHFIVSKKIL